MSNYNYLGIQLNSVAIAIIYDVTPLFLLAIQMLRNYYLYSEIKTSQ